MLRFTKIIGKVDELEGIIKKTYPDIEFQEPRQPSIYTCPWCKRGYLRTIYGKYGYFIGCSNYPNCRFTKDI